jgi:hypothetical protein
MKRKDFLENQLVRIQNNLNFWRSLPPEDDQYQNTKEYIETLSKFENEVKTELEKLN